MMSKLSGPPLYLLLLAVALELAFWASGIQLQFVEVWIVVLVVPLALTLAKPSEEEAAQKRPGKKMPEDGSLGRAAANRKRAMPGEGRPPQGQGQRRQASERPAEAQTGPSTERAAQKAKIDTCVKEGNVDQAEVLLTELVEKSNADSVSYNMVISTCSKKGDGEKARAWMQQMLDKGVKPDIASFNSAIDSCARCGDRVGAEKWLVRMKDAGVHPNTITYNALIN